MTKKNYPRYTKKVGRQVCDYVADGKTFTEIEKLDNMPSRKSINNWLSRNEEFKQLYHDTLRDKFNDLSTELTALTAKGNWPTLESIMQEKPHLPEAQAKVELSSEISRLKARIDILKTILTRVAGKFNTMYEAETQKVKHEADLTTQHQIVIMDYSSKDIKTIDGEVLDDN